MSDSTFELVPFAEAVARFDLAAHFDEYALKMYAEDNRAVRYYSDTATIEGDIDLDALFWDGELGGIYAAKDLTVTGSVLNWEIDTTAVFLLVGRDLLCRNMIAGCAEIIVERDVRSEDLVISTYNHGRLEIKGDVHAKYFIVDDHNTSVGGTLHGGGWTDMQGTNIRVSRWQNEVRPEFKAEFFDDEGYMSCGNGNVDLVKALLAGRDILVK